MFSATEANWGEDLDITPEQWQAYEAAWEALEEAEKPIRAVWEIKQAEYRRQLDERQKPRVISPPPAWNPCDAPPL